MKAFKRIGAIVLTGAMAIGMSSMAFAANGDVANNGIAGNNNGIWAETDTPVTQGTALTFHKEITVYNPETCVVNAPAVTYAYSIAPGAANMTVTDDKLNHNPNANVSVLTKSGVGSPTITGFSLDPEKDTLDASEFGTANWFDVKINFADVNFLTAGTGAGVYRYVITETTSKVDKAASGIKDGNDANDDQLYLDVYVDGDGTIYGYVLFQNDINIDATTSAADAAEAAGKVAGYVSGEDGNEYITEESSSADKYFTFNLEIKKDVVNDNYISTTGHQFPFSVAFANGTVTADVLPIVSKTGTATIPTLDAAGGIASFDQDGTNLKIADDGVVLFKGLPAGTTVTIDEENTVTGTVYLTKTTGATVNEADGINLSWNTWASADANWADKTDGTGTVYATGGTALNRVESNYTTDSARVMFINTLLQISPTGVVLRFAPYAMMLAAGLSLLLVSRRRRRLAEEA